MRTALLAAALLGAVAVAGVPAGYTALPDKASADMTKAVYSASGNDWEVRTGPAHILYAARDTASGVYAANATIVQLEKPAHPEAYGIFIGGKSLGDPDQQTYIYFLVRGTGEYLVKVRTGSKTTTVTDWKASPIVPKEDASGKATYKLKVHVAPNAIHFMVNGDLVAEVPKTGNPTEGIVGLRINHNLHLMVTPLTITR